MTAIEKADSLNEMIEGANSNNLFMQCNTPDHSAFRFLPDGFTARLCKREELIIWKAMWAQGKYMDFVNYYYDAVYAPHEDEFFSRCTFAVDVNDNPVATAGVWRSYGRINTVLWFHVLPEYEGRGIGRGIFSEVLKNAGFPIYVHTHPIANRAIKLYSDFGFKLVTDPVVGYRENNLYASMPYLKEVLPKRDYETLQTIKANPELLDAALLNELAEF
jgi:GNAT superfamily N-acetyltransferase